MLALLKRAHGIELKSASSTIEEVVARQFVERLARERGITLPGGDMFAEGPAAKGGVKKPAPVAKKGEPAKPAAPTLAPPRLVKTARPPLRPPPCVAAAPVATAARSRLPPGRRRTSVEEAPVEEGPDRSAPSAPAAEAPARRTCRRNADGATGRKNPPRRWLQHLRPRRREAGSGRPRGSSEHQTENRGTERARHVRGARDADSSCAPRLRPSDKVVPPRPSAPLPPATGNLARPSGPGGITTRPAPQRPSYPSDAPEHDAWWTATASDSTRASAAGAARAAAVGRRRSAASGCAALHAPADAAGRWTRGRTENSAAKCVRKRPLPPPLRRLPAR